MPCAKTAQSTVEKNNSMWTYDLMYGYKAVGQKMVMLRKSPETLTPLIIAVKLYSVHCRELRIMLKDKKTNSFL